MHNPDLAGTRKWWTLATVCTGVFMLLLDLTIVNVALPDIEHAFHASLSDLQWVVSAYALAAFLLTAGSLADLYGRRLLFASGIVLFTTGSLLCGLATGVAGFGTILTAHVRSSVVDHLSGTALAGHAHSIAHAIAGGGVPQAIAKAPPPLRGLFAGGAHTALVGGLNTILLVAAVIGFAAAAICFLLIRERDFVEAEPAEDQPEPELALAA